MDEHIENNIADVLLNEMWNSNMYILTKNIYGNFRPIPFFVLKQRKQFMFRYVCKIFWRFIVNHITAHYIHIYTIIIFCLNFIEIILGLEFRIKAPKAGMMYQFLKQLCYQPIVMQP